MSLIRTANNGKASTTWQSFFCDTTKIDVEIIGYNEDKLKLIIDRSGEFTSNIKLDFCDLMISLIFLNLLSLLVPSMCLPGASPWKYRKCIKDPSVVVFYKKMKRRYTHANYDVQNYQMMNWKKALLPLIKP
jgi:hypothetical protein